MEPLEAAKAILKIPNENYESCRKEAGIAKSVNLYNALKKCAKKQDSLEQGTKLNATSCGLVVKYSSHSKLK